MCTCAYWGGGGGCGLVLDAVRIARVCVSGVPSVEKVRRRDDLINVYWIPNVFFSMIQTCIKCVKQTFFSVLFASHRSDANTIILLDLPTKRKLFISKARTGIWN